MTHQTVDPECALDEVLAGATPLSFDEVLAALDGTVDVPLLRHLLRSGMGRGDVDVLVNLGAPAGPWYGRGTGRAADPWGTLVGSRLEHRHGHGRDAIWAANHTPYRRRHLQLVERDGPVCGLCGRRFPVDYPPEQDHRLPRSLGGSNELANLQLAHKVCNMVKGVRIDWQLPEADEVTVWFDPVNGSWREVMSRDVYEVRP